MSNCDMCGRETSDFYEVIIEGSLLNVCLNCSKFGNIVNVKKKPSEESKEKIKVSDVLRKRVKEMFSENIVDDYNIRVKKAREEKGLKQEELAKAINVKESVIHNIESKKIELNIEIAKKLENFLNIVLVEKTEVQEKAEKKIDFKNTGLTIGDLLNLNK